MIWASTESSSGRARGLTWLVTESGRITRYSTGEVEIYDLENDPDECVNLATGARDPKRRQDQSDRLTAALIDYSDTASPGPMPD